MKIAPRQEPERCARASVLTTTAAVFVSVFASSGHADVRFEPRVAVGTVYIDNIELVPSGTPKSDEMLLQTEPGLLATFQSGRLNGKLDYTLHDFRYLNDSGRNQTYHEGIIAATALLMRDLLTFDANVSYVQTLVNPLRTINFERMFDVGNVADRSVIGGGPRFHREIRGATVDAVYDYNRVRYSGRDAASVATQGSDNQRAVLSFKSEDDTQQRFEWSFDYGWHDVDYENQLSYRYQSAILTIGYDMTRNFTLLVDGGVESDVTQNIAGGKLDSERWHGGFRFSPSRSLSLETVAGHRFFGNSYRGTLHLKGRILRLDVTYVEEPTTETELAGRPAPQAEPGVPLPPDLTGLGRTSAEVFVNREARAVITLVGYKTEIAFSANRQRREYLTVNSEDTVLGTGVVVNRRLTSRLTFSAQGSYEDLKSRAGVETSYYTARLGLSYALSPTASLTGEVFHVDEDTLTHVRANAASIRFKKSFARK